MECFSMKLTKYYSRTIFLLLLSIVPKTVKKVFSSSNFSNNSVQVLSFMHSNVIIIMIIIMIIIIIIIILLYRAIFTACPKRFTILLKKSSINSIYKIIKKLKICRSIRQRPGS
mgnify:CR=1 FL=1